MMKPVLAVTLVAALLTGCGVLGGLTSRPKAQAVAPPETSAPPPVLGGRQTAESLDTTTAEERAAATNAPVAGARDLGKTTVALGSPAEPGFWLKSPLVAVAGKGKVVTAGGASVAVDLQPGSGGSLLSLAAYRALGLGLTDLPEVTVLAD